MQASDTEPQTEREASLPEMAWEAVTRLFADEAIPLAGNIAFRALFSVFPFLIFLVTLAGFFGNEGLATGIVDFLLGVAPATLVNTLAPEIHSILTVPRTGLLSISVLLTIWSAMGGVDSIRVALNRAYDVRDTRSFLQFMVCACFSSSALRHHFPHRGNASGVLACRPRHSRPLFARV